jgi:Tfp pilus assembly protein PilO
MKSSKLLMPILFIVLMAVVIYVAYSFFFQPLWDQNQELRSKVETDSVRFANLQELSRYRSLFDTKTALYKERQDVLNKVLPVTLDKLKLLVQVEQLYKQQGLTLNVLPDPTPPAQVGEDTVSNFQLTAQGNYFRVLAFLKSLLNFPNIIQVNAISMAGGEDVTVTVDCSMYLKPGAAPQ